MLQVNFRVPRLGLLAGLIIALFPSCALADQPLAATVGATPAGQPMAPGFVGLSLEYKALHLYTGRNPYAINPVFLQLVRNLVPGGKAPILRIGGDSADATWWPIRGMIPPGGISYSLTEGWLRQTQLLAQDLGAQLILGVNLAAGRPEIAATEARAFLQGIGRRSIEALEIGNEPDVYTVFPWYRDRHGNIWHARTAGYDYSEFLREFSRWRAALPSVPIAGPAYAELTWLSGLATAHPRRARPSGADDPSLPVARMRRHRIADVCVGRQHAQRQRVVGDGGRRRALRHRGSQRRASLPDRRDELGRDRELHRPSERGRHVLLGAVGARHAVQPREHRGRRRELPHAAAGRLRDVHVHPARQDMARVRPSGLLRDADVRSGVPARVAAAADDADLRRLSDLQHAREGVGHACRRRHDQGDADQQGPGLRPHRRCDAPADGQLRDARVIAGAERQLDHRRDARRPDIRRRHDYWAPRSAAADHGDAAARDISGERARRKRGAAHATGPLS